MADLRPQYSEEVVAHGHPSKADVTNRAWNIEHAEDGTHKVLPGESGIIMLFGQSAAPTGWTKKTDWQNNAMLCYATGDIINGGAVNPQSAHTHTGPSHTHGVGTYAGPNHNHQWYNYYTAASDKLYDVNGNEQVIQTEVNVTLGILAGSANASRLKVDSYTTKNGTGVITGASAADGTAATGANTAPHYQEVIAATKD